MNIAEKERKLREFKALATGLFLIMAVLFFLTEYFLHTHPWVGYINAFSEAAMVGALADWFAVTALFHYPMGIKIPHTNLIQNKKDQIGDNLGDFVVKNFLSEENVFPYIDKLHASKYLISWAETPANITLVENMLVKTADDLIRRTDDAQITQFLAQEAQKYLGKLPLESLAASAFRYFLNENEDQKILTLLAGKIKNFVEDNRGMVEDRVQKESYTFIPNFVDKALAKKISNGLIRYFEEIETDPQHMIRQELRQQLEKFQLEVAEGHQWKDSLQQIKDRVLTEENLQKYSGDLWMYVKNLILSQLASPDSLLRQYLSGQMASAVERFKNNPEMVAKLDGFVQQKLKETVAANKEKFGELIGQTVANWEGKELSKKLELEVGKDLQFIRINGTLVGGLVGLIIYTVVQLFFHH